MFSLVLSRRQGGGDKAGVNTLILHLPLKSSFKGKSNARWQSFSPHIFPFSNGLFAWGVSHKSRIPTSWDVSCSLTKTTAPRHHMPRASIRVFLKLFLCKSRTGVSWLCLDCVWLSGWEGSVSLTLCYSFQRYSRWAAPQVPGAWHLSLWWDHLDLLMASTFSDAVVMILGTLTMLLVLDEKAEIQYWCALFTKDDDGYDGSKCRRCNSKSMSSMLKF